MIIQVNLHEAKTQLSRLIEKVLAGEEVTIARAGKPVIDLIRHRERPVVFGSLKGWHVHPEDLEGVDTDIQEMFYGLGWESIPAPDRGLASEGSSDSDPAGHQRRDPAAHGIPTGRPLRSARHRAIAPGPLLRDLRHGGDRAADDRQVATAAARRSPCEARSSARDSPSCPFTRATPRRSGALPPWLTTTRSTGCCSRRPLPKACGS